MFRYNFSTGIRGITNNDIDLYSLYEYMNEYKSCSPKYLCYSGLHGFWGNRSQGYADPNRLTKTKFICHSGGAPLGGIFFIYSDDVKF